MNSEEIYDVIQEIANEPSKNAKIKMLSWALEDENFVDILWHTYNPFIMYGVRDIKEPNKTGATLFNWETFDILDALSRRNLTGNAAREAIDAHINLLGYKSQQLFKMILEKNMRAGFDSKSINKAYGSELIPIKKYMRFSLPKNINMDKFQFPAYSQEKADGLFVNITKDENKITMLSRNYQPMPIDSYNDLIIELNPHMQNGYQYHGELLVEVNGEILERKKSNGIIRHVNLGGSFKNGEYPVFVVWDRVYVKDIIDGKSSTSYQTRFNELHYDLLHLDDVNLGIDLKYTRIIDTVIVNNLKEAEEHFIKVVKQGKEGTILKESNLIWKDGTTTHGVKFKKEFEGSLRIIDFLEGTGANKDTFGSLLCVTEDGDLSVGIGNLSDALTQEIHSNYGDWLYAIIDVTYSQVICDEKGNYSLFEPKFVERRYDKEVADTLEHLLAIQDGVYDDINTGA